MLSNWKHSPCVRSGLHCHKPWSKARWSRWIPGTACQPEHRHCSLSQLLSGHLSGAWRAVSGQRWQSAGFRAFPARLRVHGMDGARGLARSPADYRFEGIFPISQSSFLRFRSPVTTMFRFALPASLLQPWSGARPCPGSDACFGPAPVSRQTERQKLFGTSRAATRILTPFAASASVLPLPLFLLPWRW